MGRWQGTPTPPHLNQRVMNHATAARAQRQPTKLDTGLQHYQASWAGRPTWNSSSWSVMVMPSRRLRKRVTLSLDFCGAGR